MKDGGPAEYRRENVYRNKIAKEQYPECYAADQPACRITHLGKWKPPKRMDYPEGIARCAVAEDWRRLLASKEQLLHHRPQPSVRLTDAVPLV
jgi:hypothetical protein